MCVRCNTKYPAAGWAAMQGTWVEFAGIALASLAMLLPWITESQLTSPVGVWGTNQQHKNLSFKKDLRLFRQVLTVFFWCGGTQFFLENQRRSEVPVMQNCISCNCKSKAGEVQIRVISWLPVVSRDYNCSYYVPAERNYEMAFSIERVPSVYSWSHSTIDTSWIWYHPVDIVVEFDQQHPKFQ